MPNKTVFSLDEILEIIPHRPPFLFVDRVVRFKAGRMIQAERGIAADEPWFEGHFPGQPIMPGVLVLDALAQTSGLLMGFSKKAAEEADGESIKLFYLASSQIKFVSPAYPGDTLTLIAEKGDSFGSLHSYEVEALAGRKTVAKGTLTLAAVTEE